MELYHGSNQKVEYPEIRTAKYHKDFFWGFYCTHTQEQAERWSTRHGGKGVVNVYEYQENPALKVKVFPELSEEWLDFIVACRRGIPHEYDIVEGPMADDQIFNYVQQFIDGEISREAFWELARFRHPTHQISFHTAAALTALTFKRSYKTGGKR